MNAQQDEILDEAAQDRPAKYFIDAEMAEERRRSLTVMIASRQCYICQQAVDEEELTSVETRDLIDRIVDHCNSGNDYLLEDTPLKEAIFRVLLSRGNEPMGADEISADISERLANATNQRDTSASVIERLLQHSESYCIAPVRENEGE